MEKPNLLENIDRCSFEIGMINCFVEMVFCGVKNLALSPPMTPEDYEKIKPWSDKIVAGYGIKSWLEKQLISTALQSEKFIAGKWVILYYKTDSILQSYEKLKQKRSAMDKVQDNYQENLKALSKDFMQLLSYPDDVIEKKLSGLQVDPFILIP